MNYSKIKFKRFTVYPINIGYSFDLEVINNVLTTKDKAEIYTMWVATRYLQAEKTNRKKRNSIFENKI